MPLLFRHLTNFIGIEHELALQCPSSVKVTFTSIGILVWLVILFTYCGSIGATLHITNHIFLALPLGMVIGWMLCNIYIFIFIIFSATSLHEPVKQSKISLSKISACVYISFIALFISIPMELFLFKDFIEQDVVELKHEEIKQFESRTNKDFKDKAITLNNKYSQMFHLGVEIKSGLYNNELTKLNHEKSALISTTSEKIKASNYTHKKIEILFYKYPLSKTISLGIILLFLAPMLILFYNDNLLRYHDLKRSKDKQLIDMEYQHFKTAYSQVLQTNFQKEASWSEPYTDPPYNHIKKTKSQPQYLSQTDLLTDIYNEEE